MFDRLFERSSATQATPGSSREVSTFLCDLTIRSGLKADPDFDPLGSREYPDRFDLIRILDDLLGEAES
jgi:hypothetical protein